MKNNLRQLQATWGSLGDYLWRLEVNWVNSDDRCENSRSNWWVIVCQFITVIGSYGVAADSLWKLKFNWGSQLLTICYLKRSLCILLSDNWCKLKVSCRPLYDNSRQLVVPLVSLGDSLWPQETRKVTEIKFVAIRGHLGVTEWKFVTIIGQLSCHWVTDCDNERSPIRSLKYSSLQSEAIWGSLGDILWQREVICDVNELQFVTITGHLVFTGW